MANINNGHRCKVQWLQADLNIQYTLSHCLYWHCNPSINTHWDKDEYTVCLCNCTRIICASLLLCSVWIILWVFKILQKLYLFFDRLLLIRKWMCIVGCIFIFLSSWRPYFFLSCFRFQRQCVGLCGRMRRQTVLLLDRSQKCNGYFWWNSGMQQYTIQGGLSLKRPPRDGQKANSY